MWRKVDKNTAPQRFGKYFCSEEHVKDYTTAREAQMKNAPEQKAVAGAVKINMELKGKTIVLGVTGGIAAYWAAEIIMLRDREASVHVLMTENATHFITPLTLQTLSKIK